MNTRCLSVIAAAFFMAPAFAAEPATPAPPAAVAPAPVITQSDLLARIEKQDDSVVVLDVRTPQEFAAGHVPGARNISHDQLAARLDELTGARNKDVVLYCRSGRRSALAAETLRGTGFTKLLQLQGDFPAWEAGKLPVEKTASESSPAR